MFKHRDRFGEVVGNGLGHVGRIRGVAVPAPSTTRWTPHSRSARLVTMAAVISHTSFDSLDAYASSVFWCAVLGFMEDPDDPNEPGDEECMILSSDGAQRLLFIEVPDAKQVKNRVHLDLKPAQGTRDQELKRLLGLGAREVADRRRADGSGWVVLADPESNEFCILRGDAERAASR